MAERPGRDPFETTVELPPPPRPLPWWAVPWGTLAGRIYVLVFVGALLFVGLTVTFERRETALERELQLQRTRLLMHDLALEDLIAFQRAQDVVVTLLGRLEAGPMTLEECIAAAARRAAIDPAVLAVAAFGADGRSTCHSAGADVRVDVAGLDWFGRALAGEGPVLSDVFAGPGPAASVIFVAQGGGTADDPIVVVAAVDVAALERRLAATDLPEGARLAIVDGMGRVVFDTPDGGRVGTYLALPSAALATTDGAGIAPDARDLTGPTARAATGSVEGTDTAVPSGAIGGRAIGLAPDARDLVVVAPVPGIEDGSLLVLSVPEAALLGSEWPDLGRAAAVASALMIALFLLASVALSRLVFRPIRVLEQAMQRVADGDLTSRVAPAARRGELHRLASAFDGMTRALRQQRRALAVAADALADRERELRLLADNLVDLVYATDAAGRIAYASPSFREALGFDPEALVGRDPSSLIEAEDREAVATRLRDARGAPARIEVRLRGADGTLHWFELIVRPRRGRDGEQGGNQGTLREVTERKHLEALLAEQALHDPLTGLPNRRSFAEVVQRLLLQAKRSGELVAIGFVDLDGFKAINDTHGHQAGDVLLQEVAERLRAAVREGDVVARLGGDEFTVALRELQDERHTVAVAERMAAAFAAPFDLGFGTVAVGGSVGIALFPRHGADLDALLRAADRAMYRAKHEGGGPVVVADVPADAGAAS